MLCCKCLLQSLKTTYMRYLHTMVRISDINESLAFYCDKLGLQEARRIENEQGRFTLIFLSAPQDTRTAEQNNAPTLELTYNWPATDGSEAEIYHNGRNFGHLAYEVSNIYETCEQLQAAGVTINRPPRDGRMAFIKSPDGISIELLQAGNALPEAEPWISMSNAGNW